jgi:acetylornithine deacetylase/succinyl-diaminopimelate desuccinylase-like protein
VSRLLDRLERVYALGDRIGYSEAEDAAHVLVGGWMEEAGLEVEVDPAGNLVGRVPGEGRAVWTGSHLDSVPSGGRFDGPLGVLAGLEAVERLGVPGLAVVAFRDEERGCAGSRARASSGPLPEVLVEVHVEQGPRLDAAGAPLGVVSGIVGYVRARVELTGRAGHAGTTPMDARDDALVRAAEYVLRVRDAAGADAVATVGRLAVEPGAENVIPSRVGLTVDARALDPARLDELVAELGLEPHLRVEPVAMADEVRAALRAELEARSLPVVELPSGAGHDAGILAAAGVAGGMLFVRSRNGGVSHSPDEWSDPEDCDLAVDVLEAALARLATDPG